jgi:hypothetical protein
VDERRKVEREAEGWTKGRRRRLKQKGGRKAESGERSRGWTKGRRWREKQKGGGKSEGGDRSRRVDERQKDEERSIWL